MTKTAIAMKDLAERERHNKELERQGRINTVLSGISNVAGAITSVISPTKGLLSLAKKGLEPDAFNDFKTLYQMKQKSKLNNRDFARYRKYVSQIKGN